MIEIQFASGGAPTVALRDLRPRKIGPGDNFRSIDGSIRKTGHRLGYDYFAVSIRHLGHCHETERSVGTRGFESCCRPDFLFRPSPHFLSLRTDPARLRGRRRPATRRVLCMARTSHRAPKNGEGKSSDTWAAASSLWMREDQHATGLSLRSHWPGQGDALETIQDFTVWLEKEPRLRISDLRKLLRNRRASWRVAPIASVGRESNSPIEPTMRRLRHISRSPCHPPAIHRISSSFPAPVESRNFRAGRSPSIRGWPCRFR